MGNVGAGKNGLSWGETRFVFDIYQSYKSGRITREGQPSQQAQRVGWENGFAKYWMNKTGK